MRRLVFGVFFLILAACSNVADLEGPVEPIGNFQMGLIVPRAADNIEKGPVSREASAQEWQDAFKQSFTTRFGRFSGGKTYDIGVVVDGYILAQVGVPVVAAPKSAIIFRVIIVDSGTQTVLTEEPHQITALETLSAGSVVSSGLANTREEQIADLANSAAKATENWMRKQPWFFE